MLVSRRIAWNPSDAKARYVHMSQLYCIDWNLNYQSRSTVFIKGRCINVLGSVMVNCRAQSELKDLIDVGVNVCISCEVHQSHSI